MKIYTCNRFVKPPDLRTETGREKGRLETIMDTAMGEEEEEEEEEGEEEEEEEEEEEGYGTVGIGEGEGLIGTSIENV